MPSAKLEILRSNYFGRGKTITVKTFRKVEGSIDMWDVDADDGKRWVPGSLISKSITNLFDDGDDDADGPPKMTVPRQMTNMFGVSIMDYTYAMEIMVSQTHTPVPVQLQTTALLIRFKTDPNVIPLRTTQKKTGI